MRSGRLQQSKRQRRTDKVKTQPVRTYPGPTIERLPAEFFRWAAQKQERCASCGTRGPWDAHHALYEQHLRKEGFPLFDPRNALRLCRDCHANHHAGARRIKTASLTTENLAYMVEVLGPDRAELYIARQYDDRAKSAGDWRLS